MDKRLLIAVAVSMGILLLWWRLFPPQTPQARNPTPVAGQTESGRDSGTAQTTAPAAAPESPTAAKLASPPATRPAEQLITLESPHADYVLSSWGASLRHVKLKDRQFLLDHSNPDSGIDLVRAATEETAPLRTTFAKPSPVCRE